MPDALPIRRWMEVCLGMIGMTPKDFWDCSPAELYAAIDGFAALHTDPNSPAPLTKSELEDLMELYPD